MLLEIVTLTLVGSKTIAALTCTVTLEIDVFELEPPKTIRVVTDTAFVLLLELVAAKSARAFKTTCDVLALELDPVSCAVGVVRFAALEDVLVLEPCNAACVLKLVLLEELELEVPASVTLPVFNPTALLEVELLEA
jgi:hypothetical protein